MAVKQIPVAKLIDLCLEYGMVPDAKFHYHWDGIADWQINSLKSIGLTPAHSLLDIGCGPLRLGVHAIDYLDDGNYYGMDASPVYCKIGPQVAIEAGVTKKYHVLESPDFEFEKFNAKFDFAIAQSVFTHLSREQIRACMLHLKKVMKPGGIFLFTNIASGTARGFLYVGGIPMIAGSRCTVDFYKEMAQELGIEFIEQTVSHPTQTAHLFKF
jgi:cyclopropane fatty-acyl-phospholipid synthase-like methyltransferase